MSDRIYTRTGDSGETGLFGGGRVRKSHPRVEAYGGVDELNAILGWALTAVHHSATRERLTALQADLFALGAHLATPPAREGRRQPELPALPADRPADIEKWIDEANEALEPLRVFILPGGSAGSAALHVARTVCRRAERAVVALAAEESIDPISVILLNRLSDYLFVAARFENHIVGIPDRRWEPSTETG
ncbi:MAG: cob(I)yrinic acid a,c-diamide adenosyltransferase [Longimicrobiales bacterium]